MQRRKNKWDEQKTNGKMRDLNPAVLIIILNVNGPCMILYMITRRQGNYTEE